MPKKLGQRLGQNVVVFNREGGGSAVGAELVAKATPDGYTLLIGSTALTMNAAVSGKMSYDVRRDLAPLSLVFEQPGVLVVHPSVAANSVQQLIALARTQPGKLRYGSSGVGSVINLVTELFKYQAKIDLTHVPYKGVAPAMIDLTGGQIELVMSGITNAVPLVKSGPAESAGRYQPQAHGRAARRAPHCGAGVAGFRNLNLVRSVCACCCAVAFTGTPSMGS